MDYSILAIGVLLVVWLVGRLLLRGKRIPQPALGAYNFGGPMEAGLLRADVDVLGTVFTQVRVSDGSAPACDVLLLYGRLSANGRVDGSAKSLREIIRDSGASIVVVATEHPAEILRTAAPRASFGRANLVFTIDRKGVAFAEFLKRLFSKMMAGRSMLMAWTDLAPQHSGADHGDAPSTVFFPEIGSVSFAPPNSAQQPTSARSGTRG